MPRILYALCGALLLAAAPAAMAQTTDNGTGLTNDGGTGLTNNGGTGLTNDNGSGLTNSNGTTNANGNANSSTSNNANTANNAPPKTQLKATHQDWEVLCDEGQTSGEGCFMVQSVDQQQTGKRVMVAAVLKAKDGNAVMRITVPLGVLIPKGLSVAVDGTDVGQIGFVACFNEGCMTQVQLKPEILNKFKSGANAEITVYDLDSKPAKLPLSLSGFTAAYNDF